jgi:Major intrinsic protein
MEPWFSAAREGVSFVSVLLQQLLSYAPFIQLKQYDSWLIGDVANALTLTNTVSLCVSHLYLHGQEHDAYFWRAVIVEGLAMVASLFTTMTVVCVAIDTNKQLLFAGIFGISIFILVYFTAAISGGNLNPAVTIALVVAKRISLARGVCYIISQVRRSTAFS